MVFKRFSEALDYRLVIIMNAEDIVKLSSFMQNPITHLDLQLCRPSEEKDFDRILCGTCNYKSTMSHFITTEEQCRKILTPSRSLLYTLNLDLAKGRECSLKEGSTPRNPRQNRSHQHIGKITCCGFELQVIYELLIEALKVTDDKLKLLEGLLKIDYLKKYLIAYLEPQTLNLFVDCFYPNAPSSEVFKNFMHNFDIPQWVQTYEDPEKLNYLLCHIYCEAINFKEDGLIDLCIFHCFFLNMRPILNFQHTLEFSSYGYERYISEISSVRPNFARELLTRAGSCMPKKRIHLLLQTIWLFGISTRCNFLPENYSHPEDGAKASEALDLLWRSVPDAFLSFTEMLKILNGLLSAKEIVALHNFYTKAIGESHLNVEPRSLKHLCRTSLRKVIWENGHWLPEGIDKLGLPRSLQSFLKLEI